MLEKACRLKIAVACQQIPPTGEDKK